MITDASGLCRKLSFTFPLYELIVLSIETHTRLHDLPGRGQRVAVNNAFFYYGVQMAFLNKEIKRLITGSSVKCFPDHIALLSQNKNEFSS